MRRILITGNLGYVGPPLVRHLRRVWPGAHLIGFDAGYFAHCLTGVDVGPEVLLDAQHYGDVRAFPARLLQGIDAVVHLAAISNDPIGNLFEEATLAINCEATLSLAAAARDAGVRSFVLASSCSVYGHAEDGPRDESSRLEPLTAYARSKVLAEAGLADLAGEGFRVSCLRFATACGFSDRLRLDLVLNDFVAAARVTGTISILSDGQPWRPLIHVRDMARAFEWAIARTSGDGGNYLVVNVGADEWNHRVRDLATAVGAAFPGTAISVNPNAPPDRRSYRVSFARFRSLAPGHQPGVGLAEAVADLGEGLERARFGDANFRNSHLMRLNVLRKHRENGRLDAQLRWSW